MTAPCDGSLRRERIARAGSRCNRAVGPSQAGNTSPASGPTAADRVRVFRFVMADSTRRDVSEKRREAVAEYVTGWMNARIVGESHHGRETAVRVELPRAVPVEVAEKFLRECPYYVRGTFAVLGG